MTEDRRQKIERRGQKTNNRSQIFCFFRLSSIVHRPSSGFTLVELLIAVAVIAVGMVFVLGAFNQCVASLNTAQKMITANSLLNTKIWDLAAEASLKGGTEIGERSGVFPEPCANFNWTEEAYNISADFGNQTSFVQQEYVEQATTVSWLQAKGVKNLSVVRYVKRKPQQP